MYSFIANDNLNAFLNQQLHKMAKKEYKKIYTESINTNMVWQCDRRLLYRLLNKLGDNKDLSIIHNQYIKNKWIDILEKNTSLIKKNLIVHDWTYNLIGKIDAVISINDSLFAFMIYNLPSESFNIKSPLKKHITEIMLNMWMSDIKHGVIVYENNNTFEIKTFHITPYIPLVKYILQKVSNIQDKLYKNKLIKKKYVQKEKECHKCEYNGICWKKRSQ